MVVCPTFLRESYGRRRLPGAVTLPRVKALERHYPLLQARRLSHWPVKKLRPSAPAGKTGLSADARQAGTVTTGRVPVDAWRASDPTMAAPRARGSAFVFLRTVGLYVPRVHLSGAAIVTRVRLATASNKAHLAESRRGQTRLDALRGHPGDFHHARRGQPGDGQIAARACRNA